MSVSTERQLVIFGAGDIAELADFYFALDQGRQAAAFIVDDDFVEANSVMGRPIIPRSEALVACPPERTDFFAALSYGSMNRLRQERVCWAREVGYGLASYVSPRANIFPNVHLGDHCFILEANTVQPFAAIGDNVTLWSGNHIGHHSVIEDNVFISSQVVVSGRCRVGNGSFLGVNSTLRDGITLGERTLVGAGALVLRSGGDEAVFPGNGTRASSHKSSEIRRI